MSPPDGKGARTRAAILEAAVVAFRRDGYESATLAGIAAQLGITRPAVLHHFESKAQLLREAVRPYLERMDEFIQEVEKDPPSNPEEQRQLIADIVDLVAEHRHVAALIAIDPSINAPLGPDLDTQSRLLRFLHITEGRAGTPLAAVRSLAMLGSVMRPVLADDLVDLDDPVIRGLLVDCAMSVLQTPLPVSRGRGRTRGRGGS